MNSKFKMVLVTLPNVNTEGKRDFFYRLFSCGEYFGELHSEDMPTGKTIGGIGIDEDVFMSVDFVRGVTDAVAAFGLGDTMRELPIRYRSSLAEQTILSNEAQEIATVAVVPLKPRTVKSVVVTGVPKTPDPVPDPPKLIVLARPKALH
jgi:hypothetical protein